jgi:hypothetical protein
MKALIIDIFEADEPVSYLSHDILSVCHQHQSAVLFSQNKLATNNQLAVLFSQNKPTPTISHQPNEQTASTVSFRDSAQ